MYFVDIAAPSGTLRSIALVPLCINQFRLVPASSADIEWIRQTLDRESRKFTTSIVMAAPGPLAVTTALSQYV
jgi:poly-gamma-glutamate synthesis protein (capsule biosynthesis protein)